MKKRYAICYVSTASANMKKEEINAMFDTWEKTNQ